MVVGVVVWELHSGREHLCSFEQNTRIMLVALLVWLVFFVSIFSRALMLSVIAATVMMCVSVLGRMVNALVVGADEGRGNLR